MEKSFYILNQQNHVKEVHVRDISISLLATGDGVEVMCHKMLAGSHWTVLPETKEGELQYYFLIHGELHWVSDRQSGILHPGESFVLNRSKDVIELTALQDSEYLFICSKPIFLRHIIGLREMENMAIQIEQKDGYTADHCSRIQKISMHIADTLDLSPSQRYDLRIGSFLHDVGKVKIPNHILNKPGALTEEEWRIMRLHPVFGKEMILELNQFCLLGVCKVIEQHHERYNGTGYPYGLRGEDIHTGAAIVAVADTFDAMVTDRIYRKARTIDEAVHDLSQNRGILFHPDIVDSFLRVIDTIDLP